MPRVVRSQMPRGAVGFGLGRRTVRTSAAESRKPRTVPPKRLWKLITVSSAAASIGLIRLSRS